MSHSLNTSEDNDADSLPDNDIPNDLSMSGAAKSANVDMLLNFAVNKPMDAQMAPVNPLARCNSAVPLFADQFTSHVQNLHLVQLASLYQQNPFYYQHIYPLLSGLDQQRLLASVKGGDGGDAMPSIANPFASFGVGGHFDISMAAAAAAAAAAANASSAANQTSPKTTKGQAKRKAAAAMLDDQLFYGNVGTHLGPAKKMHKGAGSGTNKSNSDSGVATNAAEKSASPIQPGGSNNFKMFKDEPIPQGYLKFRFNEDCNFTSCGYRNHQSHFHCCRTDCYYSFCDKTRFVQHTARHERLDKLMGDDFKQYRANMRCGHAECAYNKNMGMYAHFVILF